MFMHISMDHVRFDSGFSVMRGAKIGTPNVMDYLVQLALGNVAIFVCKTATSTAVSNTISLLRK